MRHRIPNLRLPTLILHTPRARATPQPRTLAPALPLPAMLPLPTHNHTAPARGPVLSRKRLPRRKRVAAPTAPRAGKAVDTTAACVRAQRPHSLALLLLARRRRAPDVLVGFWVAAGELALEAPQRGFGELAHGEALGAPQFPVDFRVAELGRVRAVVDDELVG